MALTVKIIYLRYIFILVICYSIVRFSGIPHNLFCKTWHLLQLGITLQYFIPKQFRASYSMNKDQTVNKLKLRENDCALDLETKTAACAIVLCITRVTMTAPR